MKSYFFAAVTFCAVAFTVMAFRPSAISTPAPAAPDMKWYTWEEAMELNKTKPRKLMIDVYTDWCGWCKRMDKTTFADSAVTAYIVANFYPVKFNAEQKGEIKFDDKTFGYIAQDGGRGVHSLAYALLDGNMGYPSLVYLNEKNERIMISPGFKEPLDMLKELRFAAEEHYSKTTWEKYRTEH